MRTEQEYKNLEAERDRMADDLAAQCVRNAELIQERDALAARVEAMREAMREALKYYANFGDDDV